MVNGLGIKVELSPLTLEQHREEETPTPSAYQRKLAWHPPRGALKCPFLGRVVRLQYWAGGWLI